MEVRSTDRQLGLRNIGRNKHADEVERTFLQPDADADAGTDAVLQHQPTGEWRHR